MKYLIIITIAILFPFYVNAQITIYENHFDTPNTTVVPSCAPDLCQMMVNTLWGGTGYFACNSSNFVQDWTVETLLINGISNQYTDPTAQGGDYCIGMLSTLQDDKLALTLNSLNYPSINVSFDLSAIGVNGCGCPSVITTPTMNIKLYDSPTSSFSFLSPGTLLDQANLVGIPLGLNNYTFNWTTLTANLNNTNSTSGFVTIVFDLLAGEYAAFDNVKIEAVQPEPLLNQDTLICSVTPISLLTNPTIDTNAIFWWSPTSSLNDSTSLNPIATPSTTTTYFFYLLNQACDEIDNGNFDNGNTGFTSQYNYVLSNTTQGQYFVGSSAPAWNPVFGAFGDHTTGTGNMLIVNGSQVANTNLWCKTISVTPNTDYVFVSWTQNLNTSGASSNPPSLHYFFNGIPLGSPFAASTTAGVWEQYHQIWNSGANSSVTICIVNQNTSGLGNDFAIDDISFSPYTIQTDSVTITIQHPPNIVAGPDTTICFGTPVQLNASGANIYTWSGGATLSNAGISNPLSFSNASITYTVTGTNSAGCSNTATVSLIVNPLPTVSATASPSFVCEGNPTTLTASGASYYFWTGGVTNGVSFIPSSSSTYTVTGIDGNGCSITNTVAVNIGTNLNVTILPSNPVLCFGDSVQLVASGGITYVWSPSQFINSINTSDPIVFPNETTTYFVTATDASGCTGTSSVEIVMAAEPILVLSKSGDVECDINTIQLRASGANTYSWWPSSMLSSPNSALTNATITQPTTFIVTGTNGSCIVTDSIFVDVFNNDEASIFIPNAFSPNADGHNDCLRVRNKAKFTSYYLAVYDRWGQRIFEADTDDDCWNGEVKNQKAMAGTYFYFLRAETGCGKIFKKGDITLLR